MKVDIVFGYLLSLAAGALAKTADKLSDKKNAGNAALAVGAAYGAAAGLASVLFPLLAPLFMGLAIGNMFAGKFDTKTHQTGIAVFVSILLLFGFAGGDKALFVLVAAAAYADEVFAESAKDANRRKARGMLGETAVLRPLVPIACLVYALATGSWEPLAAMVAFDAAYVAAGMKAI
jgi:MFS family permease